MKIGIIGAVEAEVELFIKKLNSSENLSMDFPVEKVELGNLNFYEGSLNGIRVVVVCCGVGKVNAALCTQILISVFKVSSIINTGSAGGLAPELQVLDIVVSTDLVQHDVDASIFGYKKGQVPGLNSPFFNSDKGMRNTALKAFEKLKELSFDDIGFASTQGVSATAKKSAPILKDKNEKTPFTHKIIEGRIASGDQFVSSNELRMVIVKEFNPACVEMEGAAIAQVATINKIPFVILRSISDLAGKEANMSYDDFAVKAAHISSSLVLEMLNIFNTLGTN